MKTTSLKTFGTGIAALALMLVLAASAQASLVIEQTGPPLVTDSWTVPFLAYGVTFDKITGTILSGDQFESPGLTASGWTSSFTPSVASISGSTTTFLPFTVKFQGLPTDIPPVILDISVFDGATLVGEKVLEWNQAGKEFDVVPEPTTMIAGALLLLPFGASTLRILRKRQTV